MFNVIFQIPLVIKQVIIKYMIFKNILNKMNDKMLHKKSILSTIKIQRE
jgi:hypothetical protein